MLAELAAEASRRFGDRAAFATETDALTFAELDRRSDDLAVGFSRRGVGPGDVVALVLATVLEYPLCYLAAAKLGAVTAGINTRLPAAEQQRLLAVADPSLVIAEEPLPHGEIVLRSELDEVAVAGTHPDPVPIGGDAPVAIVFTSGTTGTPKGAVFGYRQLDAIRAVDIGPEWGAGGTTLAGTSLAHLGFMTKFPGALQAGRTTHLMRRWRPDDALRLTSTLKLTSLSGVPTQLALMLTSPALDEADLSALRLVLIGGGPATPALVRRARERLAVPVCTRYSCTEAGIGLGTHPTDPPEDAETTVGRPQPGVELAVRTADGTAAGVGETGDVLLRSSAVMSGYWNDPVATAKAFTDDGFVRTGDLGYVDDKGRLHLVGRTSERYVRGGYNVSPVAVEAVLATHPAVRDVAVVPQADDVMGEIGVAVVVPTAPLTLDELRDFAAARLAKHELPERLVVRSDLPLTPGDKVDRAALRSIVAGA